MVIPIMFGNSEVTYYSSCKICFRVSFLFTQINLKPVHISCVSLAQNPQFYPPPCGLVLYILFETETSFVGDHSFIDRNICLLTKNFNQITNISLKSDKIYWNINFQVFTRAFFYTTIKWAKHKSYMALVGWIYMAVLGSIIFNLTSTSVIYNCKVVFRL